MSQTPRSLQERDERPACGVQAVRVPPAIRPGGSATASAVHGDRTHAAYRRVHAVRGVRAEARPTRCRVPRALGPTQPGRYRCHCCDARSGQPDQLPEHHRPHRRGRQRVPARPSAAMSPMSVVPDRRHSASPARMSACVCSGVRDRRYAITPRSQSVKWSGSVGGIRPRAPHRSRCVCGVHQPGDDRDVAEVLVRRAGAARLHRFDAVAADGDGAALQRRAGHREHPPRGERPRPGHDRLQFEQSERGA